MSLIETYWTLKEALTLISALQPTTRAFGYHLTLGGSVLNTGSSKKDLDLFFLPLDNGKGSDADGMVAHLTSLWGAGTKLGGHGKVRSGDLTIQGGQVVRRVWMRQGEVVPAHTPGSIYHYEPYEEETAYPAEPNSPYLHKLKFKFTDLRIDAFIMTPIKPLQKETEAKPSKEATKLDEAMRHWAATAGAIGANVPAPTAQTDTVGGTGGPGTWAGVVRATEPGFRATYNYLTLDAAVATADAAPNLNNINLEAPLPTGDQE